jgi:ketol-acid reductoisomerase
VSKVHTDKDADLDVLKSKTLAVFGVGSQGHAWGFNLQDSHGPSSPGNLLLTTFDCICN